MYLTAYKPHDCRDVPRHCGSGTYKIYPGTSAGFNIYCNNRTEWWNVCTLKLRIDLVIVKSNQYRCACRFPYIMYMLNLSRLGALRIFYITGHCPNPIY